MLRRTSLLTTQRTMASVLYLALLVSLSCVLWNGADAVCRRPSSPRSSPACPSGWTKYGNRCFYFYNSQMNWASAERACIRLGGNLASIHSSSEHSFLKALVRSKKGSYQRTWVGGHDAVREGVWLWSDGSKFDYTKWGSGEPNNLGGKEHCMEINLKGSALYINDEPCTTSSFFICAKKP